MKPDTRFARRLAWVVGSALALGLGVYFGFLAPKSEDTKGIGIGLILDKQQEFRRDLIRQGKHLNELETWQIQEELARRAGLSRSGVKGFVLRAKLATDPKLKSQALLLAGDLQSAASRAQKNAESLAKSQPMAAARAFETAGDAHWRMGEFEAAAKAYSDGIELLGDRGAIPDGDLNPAASLSLDLTLLHWSRANFHPEEVRTELESAEKAVRSAVAALARGKSPIDWAAAMRLKGNVLMRLAVLPDPQEPDIQRMNQDQMAGAGAAFREAFESASKESAPDLWAAIAHDLGIFLLKNASAQTDARAMELLNEAAGFLDLALEVRTGKVQSAIADPAKLGEQLSLRAESLAFKAAVLARQCELSGGEAGERAATESLAAATAALSLSSASERSPAWMTAKWAEGTALREKVRLTAAGDAAAGKTRAPESQKALADSATSFLAALRGYPLDLDGLPAMPDRKDIFWSLQRTCDRIRTGPEASGGHEIATRIINEVRSLNRSLDKDTWKRTWMAAASAQASAHLIFSNSSVTEAEKELHLTHATQLLNSIQRMADEAKPVILSSEQRMIDHWRIPWPPDKLWREQIQEMQRILEEFRR